MTDSRPVMEQYNKLLGILGRFTQNKMNMDEVIQVFCVIDKLSPSWKDFKHTLKHKKEESILVELGSHLRIEESLRVQDSDEPKGNNVVDPSVVNMMEHNNSTRLNHVHFKRMQDMSKDGLISAFDMDTEKCFAMTDKGGEYMDTLYFQSVSIIYETTTPYTLQQNGIFERKNKELKEMVNSMLSYSGLSPANPSEQNSLRLRIKVGSDKPVRKNYEIYSGLGLLLSPSSSTGNDSEDIVGSTIESPGCVLRDMTSVFVPGDLLVSPLNESLLCLTKVALPVNQFVDASSSRHEEVKQIEVKELNSVKCEVVDGIKNEAPFLEKCVGTLSFDNKRDLTNESKGKLSKAPAEAASHDNWVACDRCNAWRLLPIGITADNLPENWWCSKSTWLPGKNYCDVSEDETTQAVREMNFKISSQNHVIGDTYHANSNANSETPPDGWKKNKSRHEGSNSSQVETSHSSMDSRQKRKRLSEANQQLLEKNIANKPIYVGRNTATVNGEPRPKKLKTMTGIDQHDHLTSTKIKNENERQTENTRASSKSKLLDRKSCEEVEMPAKKRKLKDQDTPPYANTVKEKRLKTSNTDINGEEKPLIKGNGMKIKLSVSREGSVDKSHEKLLNATSSRKDLESERFQFGATSSSSKVSGSFRRASLKEVKGSPVGTVSSSPLKAPNLDKLSPAAGRTISRKAHAKSRPEVPRIDGSGVSNEYASSQTAMTAFKKAEESKDYADRLKNSGFDYECNDAYFDSALKFLHAASLLEAYYNDFSKLKGMVDPLTVYSTSAKLSKICAEEYEKRKEMAAAALAYKCMDVAYMRVVYCKSFVTKQDMQMVTQGESPSSSAFVVDNLNNQATIIDKTMLSKNITHLGNQVVARSQANFTRLLDFTSDVSLAMEASLSTQNAYKAASTTLEESQNKEMTISVKQVVDFSFQDVKELVTLVQNAREAINRQGFKGNDKQLSEHKLFDLPLVHRRSIAAPPLSPLLLISFYWLLLMVGSPFPPIIAGIVHKIYHVSLDKEEQESWMKFRELAESITALEGMRYPIREEDLTTVKKDDNLAGFIGEYVVMPLTSPVGWYSYIPPDFNL
ncbi:cullin, conserved site-containing protein [Tanacetum coccineum]